MLPAARSTPTKNKGEFKGSLRRTLVLWLIPMAMFPLIAMSVAAYLYSSNLLRDQAVTQMQTLLNSQTNEIVLLLKTKAIRLEHVTHREDLAPQIQQAMRANRQDIQFNSLRSKMLAHFQSVNTDTDHLTFNQIMLVRSNGIIQMASREEWEGLSLHGTPVYNLLRQDQPSTVTIYDLAPLYPNQVVMLTIQPYHTEAGLLLGATVGVTESHSLKLILDPLVNLSPSADAYFVTNTLGLIGTDPYTGDLGELPSSESQKAAIESAFADRKDSGESPPPASLEYILDDGHEVIAQGKWLPGMNAGIVLEIHEEVVLGQINNLGPFTVVLLFLTMAGLLTLIGLATTRLLNPVISLTEITRRFAEGNLAQRAAVKSHDEIGLLSHSFNQMADELNNLYTSLSQKVEERTRQIRTAAEVAQGMTASSNLNDLMKTTTRLIVERFGYHHAAIFLLDRAGKYAVIRAAYSPVAEELLERGHSLEVGSASIVGWVSANNQPRVASDTFEDPIHLKNTLLTNTRAEAAIPISSGDLVLGVLDVQSTEPNVFDEETLIVLGTLANQIGSAIQNANLAESTEINLQELERLYRASRQIAQAQTEDETLSIFKAALKDAPFVTGIFRPLEDRFELESLNDLRGPFGVTMPHEIKLTPTEMVRQLAGESIFDLSVSPTINLLTAIPHALEFQSAAYLPIMRGETLDLVVMIGSRSVKLTRSLLQPYISLADLASISLEKVNAFAATDERLRELNALNAISQIVSTATDTGDLFATLHRQAQNIIGDYSFGITLYDKTSNTIRIPYSYDEGQVQQIESFPLGEGLTSVVIHTRKPLLLQEDTEKRAAALGARIYGRPARSWMGAPMLLNGEVIGALIVQDVEREQLFTENNLRFLSALAAQVAGVLYNLRLLEDSRLRAVQLETAAEIAREVSRSFNVDELLARAVNLIRDRFDFYHASVFLLNLSGEFAVIREATGEAGQQLKRAGHKLGVGSKSIVGYVSGRGEMLVISDAAKDPTYFANPLLPETKSEAAIPLKVGERILGVLDVQSTHIFAFNEDNLRTLQILADQMAVAVANSELFSETQEHLSEHRLLHHITTTAASGSTLEEAMNSAVNGLQVTLGGDRVSIFLLNREHRELQVKASVGYSDDIQQVRIPLGSGVTGWVAAHRRPLRVNDTTDEPRYIEISTNTRSELAVPLIYRNEVLGVLNVESEQPSAYSEGDEEMLGTLGGSLAAIIANARLIEQIRMQAERERQLFEVTSKIRRSTDIQTILETTGNELIKVMGARRARIQIEPVSTGRNGDEKGREHA